MNVKLHKVFLRRALWDEKETNMLLAGLFAFSEVE